ncbi:MAG: DUF3298 and DUF4163 domain-containing protein [Bacteroides sp.]|nr:DUF3298 and DUF4163 domain-containing protein [Bacteroides sp.]
MKRLAYIGSAAIVALAFSCKPSAAPDGPVLTVDSIALADSISIGLSSAEVTISGQYPDSGATALVDSTRRWLADCLSWGTFAGTARVIIPTKAEINNPQQLLAHLTKKLLASAERDFIDFNSSFPDTRLGYEYQISFEPAFMSDSLVTYVYNAYGYQGGAHGGSVAKTATFAASTGQILTYANAFLPDRRKELIARIRTALWEQYFRPTAADPGAPVSLEEALLINPQELDLPASGPQFGRDGVTFTYGQYEIAPYAAGMPACTIKYADLHPLLQAWVIPLVTDNSYTL